MLAFSSLVRLRYSSFVIEYFCSINVFECLSACVKVCIGRPTIATYYRAMKHHSQICPGFQISMNDFGDAGKSFKIDEEI